MDKWERIKEYVETERRKASRATFDAVMNYDVKTLREQQIREDALRTIEEKIKEIETGVIA